MGELDKGIRLLERQHAHEPSGLVYQTLGYLYVEKYAPENAPDFDALEAAERAAREAEGTDGAPKEAWGERSLEPAPAQPGARETWQAEKEKALAFLKESIDYDDEDSVCLDNMGQWLFRVEGDRAAARPWFDKAIAEKPSQMDTLWFLSRYDLDGGNTGAALEKLDQISEGRFSPLNYVTPELVEAEIARLRG